MDNPKNLKEINKALEHRYKLLEANIKAEKDSVKANYDKKSILEEITKLEKQGLEFSSRSFDIEKKFNNIQKGVLGALSKKLGIEKDIKTLQEKASKGNKEEQKDAKKLLGLMSGVSDGSKDFASVLEEIGNKENFKTLTEEALNFGKALKNSPDLEDKIKIEADAQQKINDFQKKFTDFADLVSSPKAMGVATIAFLGKQFLDIGKSAIQIRQDLGLSVGESASLATKTTILSKAFSLIGGDGEQIAAFSKAIASEFGSINELSFKTLTNFGLISLRTGITGDNAAKLAKSIQSIQGGSLETSLNTISTFENLSRAAGVAPKLVLDDVAESTELFAKFAKDGGENLAKAAIEARKLGLNLSAVDKISESILDFETSIEKQMEASVLLGRQLNLDKARQLALEGDLEGVLAEVKNQVGGTEALNRMNVVQRKALADAVGLEVSELSKLAAGQENVNKLTNGQMMSLGKTFAITAGIVTVLSGAVAFLVSMMPGGKLRLLRGIVGGRRGLKFGAKAGLAGGSIATVGQAMMPKAQTGGVVRETGMAVVHKGETIAGTQFGGRESNKLLKQMIEQNATLMNRLTNRVGELALSS